MQNPSTKILKNNITLVCIILLLGFVAHAGMLTAPFKTLDDSISIVNNPDIKNFAHIGKIFTSSFFGAGHYYRPMVGLSFMAEYHFFGLRPFYYNLTNLALHLAVVVTVFFLVLILIEDRTVAFFTALLFAIHPIHWEAVGNIPGRAIILSAFFTMNAFFFYLLSRENRRFALCYGLSLLFFTCGLLSKESAAMLPVLLLSYIFFIGKGKKEYLYVLPFFLVILSYMAVRYSLGITETYPWRSVHEHVFGFLTFLQACLTYLGLFVWPVGLHFDRAQKMFLGFTDPGLFATLIAFLALGFILLKKRKQLPNYCWFFIAWFCIELFPVSQIITTIGVGPGYISAAEHFLYMPSVGIFALLVLAGRKLYGLNLRSRIFSVNMCRIALTGILISLMLGTVYQQLFARTALAMFRRTLEYNPNNARILFSTGIELVNNDRFKEAESYFQRALDREPQNVSYRISLGRVLFDQGKVIEGIAVYETIMDAGKLEELLQKNLQEAYDKAIEQYENLLTEQPNNAEIYYSLGMICLRSGRMEQAVEQFEQAVTLNPLYKDALFNLALGFEEIDQPDRAVEFYERMIAVEENKKYLDHYAYIRLGGIYQRQGDILKAQMYFRKAKELTGEEN